MEGCGQFGELEKSRSRVEGKQDALKPGANGAKSEDFYGGTVKAGANMFHSNSRAWVGSNGKNVP